MTEVGKRVRGKANTPAMAHRGAHPSELGVIVAVAHSGTCWRVRWDGEKAVNTYNKRFLEMVGEADSPDISVLDD